MSTEKPQDTYREPQPSDKFTFELGKALVELAKYHPDPDKSVYYHFMHDENTGATSTVTCTPREFAEAVKDETPIGCRVANFYKSMSEAHGDPTGQLIIEALAKEAQTRAMDVGKQPD